MIKKVLIGLIAGIISGLFSTGGGMILVPAFVYLLNLEDKKARGTSIFCILPMVITSSFFYYKGNFINWKIAILCAIGGSIGGYVRSKIIKKSATDYIKNSICMFFSLCVCKNDNRLKKLRVRKERVAKMVEVLIGLISGTVSGTGMGGGTILIFLLSFLLGIEHHIAQATNLIFFIPTSIVAIIVNIKNKNIDLKLGTIISIFGILGAIIGANIAIKTDVRILKKCFGYFLAIITINEIYSIVKLYKKSKKSNTK